jgi:hypothetical protein
MVRGDLKLQVIQLSRCHRDLFNAAPVALYRRHANTAAVRLLEQIIQDSARPYHRCEAEPRPMRGAGLEGGRLRPWGIPSLASLPSNPTRR